MANKTEIYAIEIEGSTWGIDSQMDDQYRHFANIQPLTPVTFVLSYENKYTKKIAKVMQLLKRKTLKYKEYVFLRKGKFL